MFLNQAIQNSMVLQYLQPGYLLNEYRIEELLGEGGFGLTYLAFDTNLEKKVAIKEYMPSEHAIREHDSKIVAKNESSKKVYDWGLNAFINEAKILAQFEDPNIVRVHRFFKANGTAYIVMEYCEGGCLIDRISKNSQMDESELKEIFSSLVRGLQLVHNDGVLHRDIKPENIMFRQNGTPVLIDFGAARQVIGAKTRNITTIVTPGFAPIEQYGTEGNVGPWSDIYSLSAVAYLCLSGKRPPDITNRLQNDRLIKLGDKANTSSFLKSIDAGLQLHDIDRPQSLSEWSDGWIENLPNKHSSQINKDASELTVVNNDYVDVKDKNKNNIFKTISKITFIMGIVFIGVLVLLYFIKQQNQLEDTPIIDVALQSIAVLPLINLNSDEENDFLGFALANQIIDKLSYNENIRVKSSTLVQKYKQTAVDPITIGRELNVEFILSGNYINQKNLIRLNFDFLHVENNELIWRESQELSYDNLFILQDTVANLVSQKLDMGLTTLEYNNNINRKQINNIAYEYYLKGTSYPYSNEQENRLAIDLLNKTLAIEPDFAPAYLHLGMRFRELDASGSSHENDTKKAIDYYLRALELNPRYLDVLQNLSRIYYDTGEFFKAYKLAKKILIINPNDGDAYFLLGKTYRKGGMVEESIEMFKKAQSYESTTDNNAGIGIGLLSSAQYKEAKQYFDPDTKSSSALTWQGILYLRIGDNKKAFNFFQKVTVLSSSDFWKRIAEIYITIIKGEKEKRLVYLSQLILWQVNMLHFAIKTTL